MTVVSIQEFENDPRGLLERVVGGEALILTQHGTAVAEVRPTRRDEQEPRPHGLAKGQFKVPDDFDDPLPEEILRDFEGS